jgi:hypothetical protein
MAEKPARSFRPTKNLDYLGALCSSYVRNPSARPPALTTQPEPETPEPESAAKRTERQVRQCRRMAELGMQLAEAAAGRALTDQARAAADPAAKPGKDMATTFARIAGTIQHAIKLETKLTAPSRPPIRHRAAAPKAPSERPVQPPETYPEPPATEWPFLTKPAEPTAVETPPPETPQTRPSSMEPVLTDVADGKTTWLTQGPPGPTQAAPQPAKPPTPDVTKTAWTPPPPQRRATDPPRPTGPNWARLFER